MKSTDILIVDDEVGIRDLLSEILQDEGYGVAKAENATVARKMLSLIHISEPTRREWLSRMPSSA